MIQSKLFSNPNYRKVVIILLIAFLAVSIVALRQIGLRLRAAPGIPTLSFSTNPSTLQEGQNFDLMLQVNPNNASFYAFELYANYDPNQVEFQNPTNLGQNITSSFILIKSEVDTSTNTITVVGTKTGSAFSGSTNMELARVKMRVISGASGSVDFNWSGITKLGSNINKELIDGSFQIGGGGGIVPTGGVPGGPDFNLDIPSITVPGGTSVAARGEAIDVQVFLKTDTQQVKSVDFVLPYDDSILTFQDDSGDLSQNIEIDPDSGFNTQFVIKKVDTNQKKIFLALVTSLAGQDPVPINSSSDILIATVKFAVRPDAPDGVVELVPDTASTIYNMQTQNVITCVGGYRFVVGAGGGTTPPDIIPSSYPTIPQVVTYTPIPSLPPGGVTNTPYPTNPPWVYNTPFPTYPPIGGGKTIGLDISLILQGILTRPNQFNTIPVKVTVQSLFAQAILTATANFSVDNNGIWTGQVTFNNLPESDDYAVYIKGPKHLQKRICESATSEVFPGNYSCTGGLITLQAGSNSLDFSGVVQLAGDLPSQDGLVNSYDISLVRNNLGNTDPSVLSMADLNFDGIVDSQDYSLVIASVAFRS